MTRIRPLIRAAKDAEARGQWLIAAKLWADAANISAKRAIVLCYISVAMVVTAVALDIMT